ncbi:Glutamate N-acetyltransferase / N-acetylglutamate synthase [hydrothermal vent metagenome]|uniref:Glutamate N-acetyltransferase / N-acetylglutamate synthase n=1 Tax=hydrothermal vent metagenome TaxID=652676 RepID=A0A3B1E0N7_9ZZZZ
MFSIFPLKGTIGDINGFYCDGIDNVGFIYSDTLCEIEAIFTKNKFQAAPLKHFINKKSFKTNFVLINSKNANAMTGQNGIDDIDEILDKLTNINKTIVNPIMSSTGVIGVPLPKEKILNSAAKFDLLSQNGTNLSKVIMTTDNYPKSCLYKVVLQNGSSFQIGAVAKGAGMINPNLATMLCFICTDANIPKNDMKELLLVNNRTSFNAISVDGDTSTNDTVMLLANKTSSSYDKEAFKEVLKMVMNDMAMLIVEDGEGATKCVAFEIVGAINDQEAQIVAKALSNSPLVKTALFGEDPNWGRIASTIGASGVTCDEEKLTISFGDICCFYKGEIIFDKETEQKASDILKTNKFKITCDLGLKYGKFTAYGCDLGYEYIKINGNYRT